MTPEHRRLEEAQRRVKHWKRWGPYLAERQWGTVREDYSTNGDAWNHLPFDHSHLRAYRWGEDGLLGISDNHQRLCFAVALWNGADQILKERLFGLNNEQGNHGEDVKEVYFYLDSTPTHSYMKALYKYPQAAFPYDWLRQRSVELGSAGHEPELWESGVFNDDAYFDITAEYAKADVDDILIRITAVNRGSEAAMLHLLPTLWFRNRWSWGRKNRSRPVLIQTAPGRVSLVEGTLGPWSFAVESSDELLFTENDSNMHALYGDSNPFPYTKDAFHRRIIDGEQAAVNPALRGSKMCVWRKSTLAPGKSLEIRCRLHSGDMTEPFGAFEEIFERRRNEADEFYKWIQPATLSADARNVQRQAFAGLLWSKQFYHYALEDWLQGDPAYPKPPVQRLAGRNSDWPHFFTDDILSMPDKWEYPWFAAWDLAFHMIPLAQIDATYAKHQLQLLLREWYLHPNGQMPAYEWNFSDVNPPVHAWACYRIFQMDAKRCGGDKDFAFLERCFHKLLMTFTWWVNRKDSLGNNIFEGGFLGLDNIGVFDRSRPLPSGGVLEQSDATAWMAMFSLNMLRIAIELAQVNSTYEDIASKFFEHFLFIGHAFNAGEGAGLWDERDGYYYDRLRKADCSTIPMRIRSLVGLIPLLAVETWELDEYHRMPGLESRAAWFLKHRGDLTKNVVFSAATPNRPRGIIALVQPMRLLRLLEVMLDEDEFLSPHGIRSLSRFHKDHPFVFEMNGDKHRVDYTPAESTTRMFGGNSNWRGPVWFPLNYLFIEALQKFNHYYGDRLTVEFPTGSGRLMNLGQVAAELSRRLSHLFLRDEHGRRPCYGDSELFQTGPNFRDYLFFHEYFHGDNGAGLGAIHQTGWTALVAKLLEQSGE